MGAQACLAPVIRKSVRYLLPTDSIPGLRSGGAHIRHFLDCVRARKEPNATIDMGQYTNTVCCLAVESLRKGRRIRWNAEEKRKED